MPTATWVAIIVSIVMTGGMLTATLLANQQAKAYTRVEAQLQAFQQSQAKQDAEIVDNRMSAVRIDEHLKSIDGALNEIKHALGINGKGSVTP